MFQTNYGSVVTLKVPIDVEKARKYQQNLRRNEKHQKKSGSQASSCVAGSDGVSSAKDEASTTPVEKPPVRPVVISDSAVDLLADQLFPEGL